MNAQHLKRPLKALRAWPPLNLPITTALRTGLHLSGRRSSMLARFLPRAGVVRASLPGGDELRLWSRADDQVASNVFWNGWVGHEPETTVPFYGLAASAGITLDIGAHVGHFALLAGRANPAGAVYAFEPLPRVHERLLRNVVLNGVDNVTCLRLAVGSLPGTDTFFHVRQGIPSSSSLSRAFMEDVVKEKHLVTSEVEVTSIDQFAQDCGVTGIDLVKIDTEGTETDVFLGMAQTLERDRPDVFCEIMNQRSAEAIEEMLFPLDYQVFLLTDSGPIPCKKITPHPRWRNFLLRPRSRSTGELPWAGRTPRNAW